MVRNQVPRSKKLSQASLADSCQIDVVRLSAIEAGKVRPTASELMTITKQLDVTVAAFFLDPSNPSPGNDKPERSDGS
jgi:transcriptional regulator with XRE-family HTH domain